MAANNSLLSAACGLIAVAAEVLDRLQPLGVEAALAL
jgi:hypothetical protein